MMNHSEDANQIEMSSHLDTDLDAVKHSNVSAGIVTATKKKWERMLLSVSFWNKISVVACMTAVSIDPLFFYIAFLDRSRVCLGTDKRLRTTVLVTRSLTDFTFLFHIVFNLRDAVKAVASESKGRTVQKDNWFGQAKAVAKKLTWSSFISDILAILPVPHVLILALFYAPNYGFSENKMTLNYMLLAQYVPRMYRIFTSSKMLRKNSSMWFKAAFYFFMYILSSHVVGAFWYFSSVQIEAVCWHSALEGLVRFQCDDPPLSKENGGTINQTCLSSTGSENDHFKYGSFLETVNAGYTGRTRFREKLFYFMWWGLKNLSNFGTNIATSNFIWENCFAILVSGMGLVLFAFLIGNMQLSMQSSEDNNVATDKVQLKEQELQDWMDKNSLPEKLGKDAEKLKIHIMKKITKNLKDDQNAQVQNLFSLIPWNAVEDLKLSICMSLLKKVPRLENMDERGLRLICHYLKPVTYSAKTIAFRMGEPLDSMLIIMEGIMLIYPTSATTTAHQVERANYTVPFPTKIRGSLEDGDVYGDEQLLSWASPPDICMSDASYADLPILTENVKCLSEVDGFVLTAKDLKSVFSEYKLQGSYNSSRHMMEVERSVISRRTSVNRRNRINPTPRPGTEGGNEETDIEESIN